MGSLGLAHIQPQIGVDPLGGYIRFFGGSFVKVLVPLFV